MTTMDEMMEKQAKGLEPLFHDIPFRCQHCLSQLPLPLRCDVCRKEEFVIYYPKVVEVLEEGKKVPKLYPFNPVFKCSRCGNTTKIVYKQEVDMEWNK